MGAKCAKLVLAVAWMLVLVGCSASKPTPTAVPPVEVPATGPEDVIGVWLVTKMVPSGESHLEFRPDGYKWEWISGQWKGLTLASSTYDVADGQLSFAEKNCEGEKGEVVRCVGVYQAYVLKRDNKSVQLRLVTVDDKWWFRSVDLNDKVLTRVEP